MVQSLVCRRIRRLIEWIILFILGSIIFCTWLVEGFPIFACVQGGSMATTLLGSHVDSTCPNCKFTFSCDAQGCDDAPRAVCPNCAAEFAPPSSPRVLAGDRVLIDRTAFQFRRPRRWEVSPFIDRASDRTRSSGLSACPAKRSKSRTVTFTPTARFSEKPCGNSGRCESSYMTMITPARRRDGGRKTPGATGRRQQGGLVHAENTSDDIGWLVYNHASPASENSQTPATVTDYGFL